MMKVIRLEEVKVKFNKCEVYIFDVIFFVWDIDIICGI